MFSDLIVCYLFLGGVGGGACCVLSCMAMLVPADLLPASGASRRGRPIAPWHPGPYRALFAPSYAVVLVVLLLAAVSLLADVGRLDRIMLLFVAPSPSYIAVGAFSLAACIALSAGLSLAWGGYARRVSARTLRAAAVLAALAALAVVVYTGFLLQSMRAVPLWSTAWLPVLFVASSLSCGTVLVLATMQLTGASRSFASLVRRLAAADVVVILLEALSAVLLVLALAQQAGVGVEGLLGWLGVGSPSPSSASNGTMETAAASLQQLVAGESAWLFWWGFAFAGMAVPFVLDAAIAKGSRSATPLVLAAAACALTSGCIMRFCMVSAGMQPVLCVLPISS